MGRVVRLIRKTTNIGFSFSPRWPWFQWGVWHDEWDAADDLTSRGVCISISRPVAAPRPPARRPRPAQATQRLAQSSAPSAVRQRSIDVRRNSLTTELASELEAFVRQLNAADARGRIEKVSRNPRAVPAGQKTEKPSHRRSGAQPATKRARAKRRQAEREFTP
jgi:hypothetical protein